MKKKIVSAGIMFMLVLLVVTFAIYGIGLLLKNRAHALFTQNNEALTQLESRIAEQTAIASEKAQKLLAVDHNLYDHHSAEFILSELEKTIVPRVVLLSVELMRDTRSDGESYQLSVSGDVETFDALAAQIDTWKKSVLFTDVRAGGTTRDEETGRLLFSVEMYLAPATEGERPYDQGSIQQNDTTIENIPQDAESIVPPAAVQDAIDEAPETIATDEASTNEEVIQ